MPRKQKSVYERIEKVERKMLILQEQLKICSKRLIFLPDYI